MAKSLKELKKENTFLKGKCEISDISLIELVEEVVLPLLICVLLYDSSIFFPPFLRGEGGRCWGFGSNRLI